MAWFRAAGVAGMMWLGFARQAWQGFDVVWFRAAGVGGMMWLGFAVGLAGI